MSSPSETTDENEITVPVPWGHIAGKTWNDPGGTRVLLVHGMLDNAGSFDSLVPLLPDTYHFAAIDLPGHGRSSHFQWGLPLKFFDFIPAIEHFVDYLGWDEFIYIGHSLGGMLGFVFCAFFPKRVLKFVALDVFLYYGSDETNVRDLLTEYSSVKDLEKRVKSGTPPEYSYEETIDRLISSRNDHIKEESAKMLARRGLVKSGKGFRFSIDLRLKNYGKHRMSKGEFVIMINRIECPVLQLNATDSGILLKKAGVGFKVIPNILRKKNKYRMHIVEGGHNVHMDFPERLSGLVTNFLADNKSRL